MSQDPNYQPRASRETRSAPEADRPAPGPDAAGEAGANFPRDEAMEGPGSERQMDPGMAPAEGDIAQQAERPARGGAGSGRDDQFADQPAPMDSGSAGAGGGAPQDVDPGLADQAPGGPAGERSAWDRGAAGGTAASSPRNGAPAGQETDRPAEAGIGAAGGGATATGPAGQGQGLGGTVEESSLDQFRDRWPSVQGAFVDDPKNAVAEADRLVNDMIQALQQRLSRYREQIQGQVAGGDPDTEQMRQAVQGYRALVQRLLDSGI